ncbi:14615_t:CDS:1, partial [Gigaspora rosea]
NNNNNTDKATSKPFKKPNSRSGLTLELSDMTSELQTEVNRAEIQTDPIQLENAIPKSS